MTATEMPFPRPGGVHEFAPRGTVGAGALRGGVDELSKEAARQVEPAGILVLESELVRPAYAPEVVQAILRRQHAPAIVAARQQIVDGAAGRVGLALERLERENVVDLDEERKGTMVSNLLVVLCSDHGAQPMVTTGSQYL